MSINTAQGSTLSIGTTTSAENLSQFLTDSYTEVGEIEDLGEFGDQSEQVTFSNLANGRVQKLKGTRDAGVLTLVVGNADSDTGQDAMIAAELEDVLDYNFKVVLNDKLTISGTPSEYYFRGKVMSKRLNVGSVNNVVRRQFDIGVNSAIIAVAAT